MVAKVGDDAYGPALLENLNRAGVDTAAMTHTAGSSGLAPMFVADDGQNAIVVVPGANGKMDRATVDSHADLIRSAGMVLCQLEIPMDTLSYTLDLCAKAQVPVMLDPAPAAALPDVKRWQQVAWFTPNETEAAFYVGDETTSRTPRNGCMRKGCAAWCSSAALREHCLGCGRKSRVGEAVQGRRHRYRGRGRLLQWRLCRGALEGQDPWAAARFANAASAISVTRKGRRPPCRCAPKWKNFWQNTRDGKIRAISLIKYLLGCDHRGSRGATGNWIVKTIVERPFD